MSFNLSTPSNPNFFVEVDESERLMRHTNALNESSCYRAHTIRETLLKEARIMDARIQDWENGDGESADTLNEDIEIEDKGSELENERTQKTEYPTQDSVTRSKVQDMIAAELERSTSHCNALCTGKNIGGQADKGLQVGYDTAKE